MEMEEEFMDIQYYSDDSNSLADSDESSNSSDESDFEYDPNSLNNFIELDINNLPLQPERFTFTGKPEVHIQNKDNDILKYFEHFIDEDLINMIAIETNRNAETRIKTEESRPYSRNRNWKDTNKEEIYVFITVHLLQGIVNKPVLEWYWSKKRSIETPFIRSIITYERYNLLKNYIHFVDDSTFNPETHPCPKLYKIWPVIVKVNKLFQSAMTPEQDLLMDEHMHRSSMKLKQVKRSGTGVPVQTYVLSEAKSGYIWSIILYSGKDTLVNENYVKLLKPTRIVMTLVEPLLDRGYTIYSNSTYTSPELADMLTKRKTDIVGLVQKGRRDVPTPITKKKLNKGGIIAYQREKVCVMKWKGKRELTILSTMHNPDLIEVYHKSSLSFIPKAISEYNVAIGNLNDVNNDLKCCSNMVSMARRRGRRYYYKIFIHLLDQATWNAYILYKKQGGAKNHLQFRLELIDMLVAKHYSPQHPAFPLPGRSSSSTPSPLRLVEKHFLVYIPPTPKKERPTKYCHVCCSRRKENGKKVRRETRYQCGECNIGLCIPCFKIFHTQSEWK